MIADLNYYGRVGVMYNDDENKKKRKAKKPDQWSVSDILLGIFGLAALAALTIAGFKVAKWVVDTYL